MATPLPSGYYVSMVRGDKVALLAGPYDTHDDALVMVEPARSLAIEMDPWAHFDYFGTLRREPANKIGILNAALTARSQS